jgi:hypothetical protein
MLNGHGNATFLRVNDTSGKFATVFKDTGGKLAPVSTTPAAKWTKVLFLSTFMIVCS